MFAHLCFTTKAQHLELVSDLTTEAFLACFRRFISRRGLPTDVFSDNGSNFVGASNDLADLYAFFSQSKFHSSFSHFLSSIKISWHFNPPHFGGLWEATIKSMKFHLKRVVGAQKLTFEELTSILCQIEACMNSRPITNVTSHSDDGIDVLTPGHFLIGRSLVSLPTCNFSTEKFTLLKRWSLCQAHVQHWWKRWSSEYLQQLQRLHKWRKSTGDIQHNDIILVKEDNMITNHWPLAGVVSTWT